MPTIKSTHDLLGQDNAPGRADRLARSNYCYLFEALANSPTSGIFAETDDEATVLRLKEFEIATRPPLTSPPAVLMHLPAAYTYFGQFMNHDISAPAVGSLVNGDETAPAGIIGTADPPGIGKEWRANVAAILKHFINQHDRPMNLGSLYGVGPGARDSDVSGLYAADGKRFRLARTSVADDQIFADIKLDPKVVVHATDAASGQAAPDIPRKDGFPLIADRRNDGNLILSQLHLAFMLAHTRAVDALELQNPPPADVFAEARQLLTLHYHWLILNDFLPSLLSKSVLSKPLSQWVPREIAPNTVPMEFTTAAFRFGHSMVGRSYDFNANFGHEGRVSKTGAALAEIFGFTSHGKMNDLSGNTSQVPDHWVIDWDRMTRVRQPGAGPGDPDGGAEKIDLNFAPDMLNVAGDARVAEHGSIMFRNLLRGFHRRIPFGQVLADACNVPRLDPDQILLAMRQEPAPDGGYDDISAVAKNLGFDKETPAWLYFLCEAQYLEQGERVGPTASQIIADTIVGLMRHNPQSVLQYKGGKWHPKDSVLKNKDGEALVSLRTFLLFSTEGIRQT